MGVLEVWSLFGYAERPPKSLEVPDKAWALIQKVVAKAKPTTNETLLPKVAQRRHDGGWRFLDDPPVLTRVDDETRRKVVAHCPSTPSIFRRPTASCCAAMVSPTWPTASWASAASAPARTWRCSLATGITTRCSSR